jgi:hypothetical protein
MQTSSDKPGDALKNIAQKLFHILPLSLPGTQPRLPSNVFADNTGRKTKSYIPAKKIGGNATQKKTPRIPRILHGLDLGLIIRSRFAAGREG